MSALEITLVVGQSPLASSVLGMCMCFGLCYVSVIVLFVVVACYFIREVLEHPDENKIVMAITQRTQAIAENEHNTPESGNITTLAWVDLDPSDMTSTDQSMAGSDIFIDALNPNRVVL